ncbi:MAG TPA: helix-turn-helix domain-containing protein [Candidatus Paceibacterota bacterium]
MKLQKAELSFLNLSSLEAKILQTMSPDVSFTVSELSREIKFPRTSVGFTLNRLKYRGFVKKIGVKKHTEWRVIAIDSLASRLQSISHRLSIDEDNNRRNNLFVKIGYGQEGFKRAYEKMLQIQCDRVYFIQGNKAAEAGLKKINFSYYADFHKKLRKKDIVMEAIAGESILKRLENLSKEEIRAHKDRLIITYLIPDQYIDFDVDIIMLNKHLIIVDPVNEISLTINEASISKAFQIIFIGLASLGRKFDLNAFIRGSNFIH